MSDESPYILLGAYLAPRTCWVLSRLLPLSQLQRALDDAAIGGAMEREALEAWQAVTRVGRLAVSANGTKADTPTETGLVSSQEAAAVLGVTDSRARQLARAGVLPARRLAGRWMIEAAAVRRLAAERKRT